MKDDIRNLYDALVKNGYSIDDLGGSEENFRANMRDEKIRGEFYDWVVGRDDFNIGSREAYEKRMTGALNPTAEQGIIPELLGVPYPAPEVDKSQYTFTGEQLGLEDPAYEAMKVHAASPQMLEGSATLPTDNRTREELLAERKRLEDAKSEAELRLRTRRGEIASPSGMYQMGMAPVTGNQAAEITDPEMTKLYAAVNSYDNAIRSVDRKLSGEEPGFWEGVADATVRNPGFYTMGLTDMSDARGMLNIAQNGIEGREDELLADAIYSKNAEQQDEDFGFLYRAGNIFGHSVPFMVQTAVTGGFSGASRAGANLAGRLGKKAAEGTIKKKIINAMGTTIDDVIEAGLIANTAGAGGTWANIAERKAGKINIKDGDYVFENGESWMGALYKGEVSSILELYTEKLGGHLEGKLSLTKGLDKIGASRVSNVLLAAKNSDLYKGASTVMRQFGLNGYLPEALEEEANLVLNSLLVGDNSLSELYNPRTQLDIFGGMLLTVGTMQAIPGTIATAGYVKNQYQLNRADRRAADVFGEEWTTMKEALDNATNEDVAGVVSENLRDNENQNKALLDYYKRMMIMRGYNIGTVKNETAPDIEEAYTEGYSQEPTGVNAMGAVMEYNQARMDVARALGLAEDADVDAFLNGRSAEEVALGDADVENAIVNYQMQKARKEGLQERFQQTRAKQYEESDRSIDKIANNGVVYSTTINREQVYITGGTVVLDEQGFIDVNSSNNLFCLMPDGTKKPKSENELREKISMQNAEDLKAAKRAEINDRWRAEFDTAEAQAIEQEKREAGTVFDKADSMGVHRIEILNEGEQMSDILIDGKQEQIPTEELNRWKQEAGIQSTDAVADDTTDNIAPTGDNVAPVAPVEMPEGWDFFRMNGKNYSVASRNDDGSVDVMIDGKRETLPAGTDYSTSMPTDKKGEVQYEQMPVERTHEHFVQKVTDDEARAEMIEGRRKKAEAERKKFDKKPDPGLDPDKWAEVNRKWEEGKKAAQAKVDYWNEVAKREAEITRSETREAVENIKPDVVKETAEEFIAGHLPKITPESFKRETGLSNEEQSKLVGVISNEGVTIEQAAESIMENYDSELKALGFTGDMQDVRNVIIDVLSQGNPRSYAKNSREAREAENIEQQRAEAEAWAMGTFNMTLEELYVYEETLLPRLTREFEGFDYNEYYNNLAENYENDTTRESESIGRGGEVLQGEQSVLASGAPAVGVRNEGGAVSNDVQGGGQNGVAQEEAINEHVGNSEQLSSSEIPNNQSVAEGDAPGQSGVDHSLSQEEAQVFITEMEANAEVAPEIELTIENWDSLFGEDGLVETPIGEVKMGENQFTKLMRQGRDGKLGMVKPTLENPDVIIEDESKAKNGETERPSSYVFVKSFKKADGSRYYYFTSVTVSKDGKEVIVSNQEKRRNAIANLLTNGKLVWKHADNVSNASDVANGLYSSQGNSSDLAAEGTDAPQTNVGVNEVYNRHTTAKQPTENVIAELSEPTQSVTASDVSKPQVPEEGGKELLNAETATTSASEDRNSVSNSQENAQKSGEIAENGGEKKSSIIEEAEAEYRNNPLHGVQFSIDADAYNNEDVTFGESEQSTEGGALVSYQDVIYKGQTIGWVKETQSGRMFAPMVTSFYVPLENATEEDKRSPHYFEGEEDYMRFATLQQMVDYINSRPQQGKIQEPRSVEENLDNGDKRITNYNSRGEVATVAIERDGKVIAVDSYDEGVLFEHTEYDGNGKASLVTRYDKQGNVISTQRYVNGIESKAYVKETMRTAPLRARAEKWMKETGVPVRLIGIGEEITNSTARRAINAGEKVTGWIDNDEVVLYLPNIRNAKEIDDTFVHEVVAHKGLKALMGDDFNALCDKVWEMMSEEQRAYYLGYPGVNGDTRKAADEYMAHLAEGVDLTDADKTVWQRIVDAVREFLVKHGMKMTDRDIENLIKASYANLKSTEQRAESKEGALFRTTYHGSGAKFDRFDHSFMGTGEGAQAFGWGTYVTDVEGIGRTYATTMRDKAISDKHRENAIINNLARQVLASNNGDKNAALEELRNLLNESWSDKKRVKAEIKIIETGKFLPETKVKANLYSVEIPDDNGSNYLYWDEVVPKKVETAVKERLLERLSEGQGEAYKSDLKQELDEVFRYSDFNGRSLYKNISAYLGGDKQASLFLSDMGFVGISYPANATTGGRADGARNYVIFNENDAQIKDRTMFRIADSERRQEKKRINDIIDTAAGFVTVGGKKQATKNRLKKEAERKELAKEMYSSVLKGDFNDVTLAQIDKFIEDATPLNPFGRRISQRLPQRMERALRQGARTNAVDALFSRISESAVPANERFSEAGRREIEERKKELLKGWAIATGNWHTDLKEFTDDTEPIGEGKDSKVYSSKDGRYVIKASKGKPYGKRFRPDIDNIALFNDVFRDTRYEILGYGEIDGEFVRILQQPIVDFAQSAPLTSEERREYMQSLGFEPLNDANTAFADGEIVVADLQKGNVVRDAAGNISVIDADAKLHTKDVGGDYTYPPVEDDLPEDSGTRFRIANENQEIFVSNAQRAVEGIQQNKATAEQWIAMLKKNGGLKAGEDAWLGLEEWLNEKQGAVTKQEILDYIGENKIQIEEVEYEDLGKSIDYELAAVEGNLERARRDLAYEEAQVSIAEKWLQDSQEEYDSFLSTANRLKTEYGENSPEYRNYIFYDSYTDVLANAKRALENAKSDVEYRRQQIAELEKAVKEKQNQKTRGINRTRLDYTTVGLENKREIALVVPTIESWNASDEIHFGDAGNGRAVVWVRFGETTDSEGNRVLVIDEIQSKRHQEGREKGYEKTDANDAFETYRDKMMEKYNLPSDQIYKILANEEKEEFDRLRTAANEEFRTSSDVPSAPFEKNWHELAMKRMLRLAAEEGFDKVAWTTGEQQAERYNIRHVVNKLEVSSPDSEGEREVNIVTDRADIYLDVNSEGMIIGQQDTFANNLVGESLSDILGKEVAASILAGEYDDTITNGHDITFGGEGMKGFYDRMLPSFVQKYTKKWGAKVGEVTMPNLSENNTMHSVDVTPEMQESVMQGQTMFRMGSRVDARMAEVAAHFEGKQLTAEQQAVVDVFGGKADNLTISVKTGDGNERKVVMRQGNEMGAGAKHSLFRHYGMNNGAITADDILLIPEILANGERVEKKRGKKTVIEYKYTDNNGVEYTVVTENNKGREEFANFYTNRKASSAARKTRSEEARDTADDASEDKGSDNSSNTQEEETRFRREVEETIEQQEENEVNIARETVTSLGEKLNSPVKIIDDLESVPENRRKWKGWFDPKTGEVVVVMPNHVSTEDAVQTVLHETVAHKGLRAVLGEKFDEFLDGVYKDASQKVKRGINDKFLNALKNGSALTVREATEEYIAELAERDFEGYRDTWNAIRQWFRNFFRNFMNMEITDGELRYLLWKNYNRMKSGPIEIILDRAMEANTGTGKVMARTAETFSTVDSYNKNVKGFKNKVKEGWYDEMRSVKVAQEAIEKELGREVLDSENVYLYANHLPSINKNKKEVFDNKYLKPFTSLLKKLYELEVNGQKMDEKSVERYTNAKHGIERNREMSVKKALTEVQDGKKVFNEEAYAAWAQERDAVRKRKLPWTEEQRELDKVAKKYGAKIRDFSGLTAIFDAEGEMKYAQIADAAYKYVADVESTGGKNVKELWKLIKGMTDYSLKEAYESGMMSKSTYEHIKQMYRYYVPLRGFTDQTAEDFFDYVEGDHSPLNAVVKTAKGRTSEAENIFATILNMANSAIVQGSKNRLKQRLLNLAMRSRTGLLSVDNAWYAKVGDEYIPVEYPENADEYAAFEERMKELEKNGEVVRHRPGLEIGRKVADKWNQQQHAVRVKRNGREYVVWVNGDPRLANAVNGMLRENFDETWIGALNRWCAQMVTQFSPTFIFTNLVRDVQEASMTYAVRRGTKMMGNFDLNVAANSVKMMSLYLKHKKGALNEEIPVERYFKEFLENGGETGYTEMISIEQYEKQLKKLTEGLNMKNATGRAFEAVGEGVEFANRCIENLCRFSAYQTSREAGMSILKSIEDAKEVSVNFNRKGSGAMGQKYAKVGYMFLNPAIQSLAKRILLTKKFPKKMAVVWAGEFVMGATVPLLWSLIWSMFGDDEDKDELMGNYFNLNDYRRRSGLCLPGKDGVFHIPLSHEARALYGLGELFTSYVMGHEEYDNVPIQIFNTLSQSLPLNPLDGWAPGKNILESMAYNLTPDAVKPIAEVVMNRDFAGNKIHNRSDFNEHLPEYMRGKRGTADIFTDISKLLSGKDVYGKSWFDTALGTLVNSSTLEHLVEGYLGGAYTFADKAIKSTKWALGDEEYAEFKNIPIGSSFYTSLAKYEDKPTEGRTRRDWEDAFRFYDQEVKWYNDKEKAAKNDEKNGEESGTLTLEQMERNGELLMIDIFNDGNEKLKELYGASDVARRNGEFDKVEEIDQQIYAEKRNIISLMEQLADDPMVGYTFKRNKIEGPYGERETYGDVRDVNVINDFQKELKPIIEEREKSADKDKYQKQYDLWRGLKNAEEWISNRKSGMKKKPEKADELMTKIREKRAEAIELINNYRNNE